MAYIKCEFHDSEEELMREIYSYLEEKLGPRSPKPPRKNTAGKWHVYLETPNHKLETKAGAARKDLTN